MWNLVYNAITAFGAYMGRKVSFLKITLNTLLVNRRSSCSGINLQGPMEGPALIF